MSDVVPTKLADSERMAIGRVKHDPIARKLNPRFKIVLEILPDAFGRSDIQRLRAFLKSALRQWGIKNQGLEPDTTMLPVRPIQ